MRRRQAPWQGSSELRFLLVLGLSVARMALLRPASPVLWMLAVMLDASIAGAGWWATAPLRERYGEEFNSRGSFVGLTLVPGLLGAAAMVYDVLHPVW